MAKFSFRVFKKGKPIYWVIGAVVIFVLFYLMFNKGGSSSTTSGGVVVQSTGPSEAMQAAALQASTVMQSAQLSANVEAARIAAERDASGLGAQVALAQLLSGEKVALANLSTGRDIAELNAQTNLLINDQNLSYNLESARVASETQIGLRGIDVALLNKQMDTQFAMFQEQSKNLIAQSLIAQIPSLKKGDRDSALISLAIGAPSSHGGITGPSVSPGLLTRQ